MVQFKNVLPISNVDYDMSYYFHNSNLSINHFHTIGRYIHEHLDIQL